MTQLIVNPHPLTLAGRQNFTAAELLPRENLADYLQRHGVDVTVGDWRVCIGGAEVPALMWARTRPQHGQVVECRRMAGRDVARAAALIVLSYYTFGGGTSLGAAWFGAGTAGAFFTNAAVYMIGASVINRVLGPKGRLSSYDQSTGTTHSLSGGRNRARPFEPVGLVLGTVKVVPDYAAQPYSWFEGDNQVQLLRFSAGINCASVDDVKIGENALTAYTGVQEMRAGFTTGNTPNIAWANVDTSAGAVLDAATGPGGWVTRTSSVDTVRMTLDLVANLYSMNDSGGMNTAMVQVNIEVRLLPSGSFAALATTTLRSTATKPVRVTVDTGTLTAGQYEVRCRKVQANVSGTRDANLVEWVALKSYQLDAADYTGLPQYGLRITASGQLNGVLDELSWVATAEDTPVWDGTAFVDGPTSNPGALLLQMARGIYGPDGRLLAGLGLPDAQIDIDALKAFTLHCDAQGYTFDHWFDAPISCLEMLEAIAAAGLGSISHHPGKLSVIWLAAGQPIEAVVNMANMKQGSFRVDYATRETADEIEVSWFDAASDWKPKSLRLLAPGVGVPRETARLAPMGVHSEDGAVLMGRLVMAQNIYGRKAVSWEMDLEHVTFRRYSIVALSHDLTQWGYGGRVQAAVDVAGVITLTLDREVPANAVRYIALRIPGEVGYRVFTVVSFTGMAHQVTLVEAWPGGVALPGNSSSNPAHDTLWIYDFKAEPGLRLRVTNIEPGSDLSGARITATPEPDAFWTYMSSGTYTPGPAPAGAVPVVASNLVVTQRTLDVTYSNSAQLDLTFDLSGPFSVAEIWGAPEGDTLQLVGRTTVASFGTINVGNDGAYSIEVRPFDRQGRLGTVVATDFVVTLGTPLGVDPPTYPGFDFGSFAVSATDTSSPVTATVRFRNNGTIEEIVNGGAPAVIGNWYTPTTSGIGSSHWMRTGKVSGTSPVGTMGSWISVFTEPEFTLTLTNIGERLTQLSHQFSSSALGTPIVGSGLTSLACELT